MDIIFSSSENGFFTRQITPDEQESGLIPARISAVHKEAYRLFSAHGETSGKLKGSVFYQHPGQALYPAVGDYVLIRHNAQGNDIIHRVLQRRSSFVRANPSQLNAAEKGTQQETVAANFDTVFLVMSLNEDFNPRKMERYLAAAWQSGALPVVLLSKADICPDATAYMQEMRRLAIGIEVLPVSALTGYNMQRVLEIAAPGTTVVFLGSSGVGKSSLINALLGQNALKVAQIRESDGRGRHTTTHRQLLSLENGAFLIDTPGVRELALWDVQEGLEQTFADIEELSAQCRFRDCKHDKEPGCAVRAAIDSGQLDAKRFRSYQKMEKEAQYSAMKASQRARRR